MYTKFRKNAYGFSLFTKFRNCNFSIKMLFSMYFSGWHGLCISTKQEHNEQNRVAWGDARKLKGLIMRTGKIENGLAILGVLIVLFAVTSAANTALADDSNNFEGNLKIESLTTR